MIRGTLVFTFDGNGAGVADFPADTTIEANISGIKLDAGVDGQITYEYETSADTLEFVDQDSTAAFSSELNILDIEDVLTLPTGPLDYSCDGDAMTIAGEEQAFEYRRSD